MYVHVFSIALEEKKGEISVEIFNENKKLIFGEINIAVFIILIFFHADY